MYKFVAALGAVLSLAACETWETTNLESEAKQVQVTPVTAEAVTLTSAAFDPATQVKLGDLKVTVNKTTAFHANPTAEAVEDKLQEDAAKLGATQVTDVVISDVEITPFSWGTRTGTGVAVKPKH